MKKMEKKLLGILSLLVISSAVMIVPVAGVDATSTITGNLSSYISLTTGGGITDWALAYGTNTNTTGVWLNLTCNYPGWTITAKDALDSSKTANSTGRMEESASGAYVAPYYFLETPMAIVGTTNATHYTAETGGQLHTDGSVLPIYTGQILATGVGTFNNMPIQTDQAVTYNDAVLASGELYKIVVTFTALIP